MTTDRVKGKVAYTCDLNGCLEGYETSHGSFKEAAEEAKSEGWAFAKRDDEWKHFCCRRHEEMEYRGQSLVKP